MATTRDISTRPLIRGSAVVQGPNTLVVIGASGSFTMSMERVEETLHRNDRKHGIPTIRDAVDLRLHAWPNPNESPVLCDANNSHAMEMIDLIFRLFSS